MKTLKYSRQRESIKNCLAARCDHPTADALYASIREEFPNISLGTVYRNLNLLVELGEIQKLSFGDGSDHFDSRITPHYHFVCKCCRQVSDLPMSPLDEINSLAQRYYDGVIESHTTTFYGLCQTCREGKS
ncbi:MAG: transcriptional repressor [Lachnospiraceae bacterium]|nr:transcriptional repressor [Lachnospiraceae bacterium]